MGLFGYDIVMIHCNGQCATSNTHDCAHTLDNVLGDLKSRNDVYLPSNYRFIVILFLVNVISLEKY